MKILLFFLVITAALSEEISVYNKYYMDTNDTIISEIKPDKSKFKNWLKPKEDGTFTGYRFSEKLNKWIDIKKIWLAEKINTDDIFDCTKERKGLIFRHDGKNVAFCSEDGFWFLISKKQPKNNKN